MTLSNPLDFSGRRPEPSTTTNGANVSVDPNKELLAKAQRLIEERRNSRGYLEPDYASMSRSMAEVMQQMLDSLQTSVLDPTTEKEWGWSFDRGHVKAISEKSARESVARFNSPDVVLVTRTIGLWVVEQEGQG